MAITKPRKILGYTILCCVTACTSRGPTTDIHSESPRTALSQQSITTSAANTESKPLVRDPIAHSLRVDGAGQALNTPTAPMPTAIMPPEKPTERFTIRDEQGRQIEVYPPISNEQRAPFVVLLHATCMQPAWVCDWFGSAGRDSGWLICPSGNSTCAGEPDWYGPGSEKAAFLQNALTKVEASVPMFIDEQPGVLIGWSRGAFAARDILYASLTDAKLSPLAKRFRGLVLLAADVKPDVSKLKSAGITRVVMAAGDFDGSKRTMVPAVAALRAGGMEARYVSLGKIGHVWPNDFEARMREPIAWAAHAPP